MRGCESKHGGQEGKQVAMGHTKEQTDVFGAR